MFSSCLVNIMSRFLFDKFNYKTLEVKTREDCYQMIADSKTANIRYFAYDTETTGLDFMHDKPFLIIFGFDKNVYYWEASHREATNAMYAIVKHFKKMLFAHNAKYDYHMLHTDISLQ